MAICRDEIAETIERFIRENFGVTDGEDGFTRQAHLYESGFVDSPGTVELISFIESAFAIQLQDEDIFTEAFTTINGISGVVHARLHGPASDGRG